MKYYSAMGRKLRRHGQVTRLFRRWVSTGFTVIPEPLFSELDVQFPRLPNPMIILFVFPHLSAEQTPVPGYSTMFPLYETVHFALPGEL